MDMTNLCEEVKTNLILTAARVGTCAVAGDLERNRVNYGVVTAYAEMLHRMGHQVDVPVWEDDGLLKIPKVCIDGKTTHFGPQQRASGRAANRRERSIP